MLPIMLYVQSAPKMQGVQVPYTINNEWMNEVIRFNSKVLFDNEVRINVVHRYAEDKKSDWKKLCKN